MARSDRPSLLAEHPLGRQARLLERRRRRRV